MDFEVTTSLPDGDHFAQTDEKGKPRDLSMAQFKLKEYAIWELKVVDSEVRPNVLTIPREIH